MKQFRRGASAAALTRRPIPIAAFPPQMQCHEAFARALAPPSPPPPSSRPVETLPLTEGRQPFDVLVKVRDDSLVLADWPLEKRPRGGPSAGSGGGTRRSKAAAAAAYFLRRAHQRQPQGWASLGAQLVTLANPTDLAAGAPPPSTAQPMAEDRGGAEAGGAAEAPHLREGGGSLSTHHAVLALPVPASLSDKCAVVDGAVHPLRLHLFYGAGRWSPSVHPHAPGLSLPLFLFISLARGQVPLGRSFSPGLFSTTLNASPSPGAATTSSFWQSRTNNRMIR